MVAFATVSLVYGALYLGIKITVDNHIPPIMSAGLRYLIAGSGLLTVLRLRGTVVRIDRRSRRRTALLGGLLLAPFALVGLAERDVSSGLTALLLATVPLVVVALRVGIERVPVERLVLAGTVVGFVGVGFLSFAHGERAEGTAVATAFVLVAAAAVGLGTFLVPRVPVTSDAFVAAGWQLVWAGVLLVPIGCAAGEVTGFDPSAVGSDGVLAYVLLVTVATVPPYASYIWLLRHVPPSQVAATSYVSPLVAVFLGWLVAGEDVTLATLGGGAMIVVSVVVVSARDA